MAPAPHILLVSATTGYQVQRFRDEAAALGWRLTLATDRCDHLDDPWGDQAVPVRFEDPAAARKQVRARAPFDGVAACGDRAAVLAARLAEGLGLAFHSVQAAQRCHDKFAFKQTLAAAGLPLPWFRRQPLRAHAAALASAVEYPCVLKPLILSGSRGVIRANDPAEFVAAFARIRRMLESPAIQQCQEPNSAWIQIEGYIPGTEFALDGWMAEGHLQVFALFDKPDPLEGPYFEENLYVTPSRLPADQQDRIRTTIEAAARAAGLGPGPIHAEVRADFQESSRAPVYVLEIAARSIGGLCGRALRFQGPGGTTASLEELLMRGALGERMGAWGREPEGAGVMMIPIPRSGVLAEVDGIEAAAQVPGIETIEITAKTNQPLLVLPEGTTYLGFIFARGGSAAAVEQALRAAHARLRIAMRDTLPVLASAGQ